MRVLAVAAGTVPAAYAVAGPVPVPLAFLAVAAVLALWYVGYAAMARHAGGAGPLYGYVARGLGRPAGLGAALVAFVAYNLLQVSLYGAFGPAAASYALGALGVRAAWWIWALGAWLAVAVLGRLGAGRGGRVLLVVLCTEVAAVLAFVASGLPHPLAQVLYLTGLLAAAQGLHRLAVRYMRALGREQVFHPRPRRTWPAAPDLAWIGQSLLGLAAILACAAAGWDPRARLFLWLVTGGGLGVLLLVTGVSPAVMVFFLRRYQGESVWHRLVAPGLASLALVVMVRLAVEHDATVLGVPPGSAVAAWFPVMYLIVAAVGAGWALLLKLVRPALYQTIGVAEDAAPVPRVPSPRPPLSVAGLPRPQRAPGV